MRKSMCLIIALILIMSTGTVFAEIVDYNESWAKDEISYMIKKGIVSGYPDKTFKPNNNMTKAEFYTVVNALVGYEDLGEADYEDVNPGHWFYSQVQKASKANYLPKGKKLNPNENITRGEVVRIIGEIFAIEEDIEAANDFNDSESLPKEIKAILGGLKEKGYIAGYPDKTFRAEAEITRAEVVKILYSLLDEKLKVDEEVEEVEEEVKVEEKEEKEDKKDIVDKEDSTGGKEIEMYIYFNKSLDRDRAENPTNYLFRKERNGKVYDLTDLNGKAIIDSDGKRLILSSAEFEDEEYKFLELSPSLRDIDNNRIGENRFFEIKDFQLIVDSK